MNEDGKQTDLNNQQLSTEVIGGGGSSNALVSADDYIKLYEVAAHLHQSGMYKGAGNPAGVFAIILLGRERGIPPMTALQNISVIDGKPSFSSAMMLGLAKKSGIKYEVKLQTNKGARINFISSDMEYEVEFLEEDAKRAGLLSKTNWVKYPKNMYFWRAVSDGLKVVAPEIFAGIYTADEMSGGDVSTIDGANATELAKAEKAAHNRKHGLNPDFVPATSVQIETIELQKEESWVPADIKELCDVWLRTDLKSRGKADNMIKRLVECRTDYDNKQKQNSENSQDETDGEGTPSPDKNQEVKESPGTAEPESIVEPVSVSVTKPEIPKKKNLPKDENGNYDLPDTEYMVLSREALVLRNLILAEYKNALYSRVDPTFRAEVESFIENTPIPIGLENVTRHVALSRTYLTGIRNSIKTAGNAPEKQAESSSVQSDELLPDLSNYNGDDKETLDLQHHIASIKKELEYRELGEVLKAEVLTFLKRDFRNINPGDIESEVRAALSLYRDCNLKNVRPDVNTNDLFSNTVQTPKQKEFTDKALLCGEIVKYENNIYKKNKIDNMARDNERLLFLGTLDLNKADGSKLETYKKNLARKQAEKDDF